MLFKAFDSVSLSSTFLEAFLAIGKIFYLLWQIFYAMGQIFIVANGPINEQII